MPREDRREALQSATHTAGALQAFLMSALGATMHARGPLRPLRRAQEAAGGGSGGRGKHGPLG